MPDPVAFEKYLGRSGEHKSQSPQETRVWGVRYTDDGATAVVTVLAVAPATVDTADGKTLKLSGVSFGQDTDDMLTVSVKYGAPERSEPEINQVRIRVSVSGGTQHVVQAKQHIQTYPPGAASFDGVINVTLDGDVGGVDVEAESFDFSINKIFEGTGAPSLMDLYAACKHTNDSSVTYTDTVNGLTVSAQEGEIFLKNLELGEARADGGLEITYNMAFSPNVTNRTIGDIENIDKKGWEYIWVYYVPKVVPAGEPAFGSVAKSVHVERMYDDADLQGGIGL